MTDTFIENLKDCSITNYLNNHVYKHHTLTLKNKLKCFALLSGENIFL